MKLRNYAILLAAAFAASCSSDFDDFEANVESQNDPRMFQVGEGFALTSVAEEGSRTNWKWNDDYTGLVNVFLPQYEAAGSVTAGDALSAHVDANSIAIGLCWLGDNVDKNVRTNYMFSHYGWMKNGKSDPKINACTGAFGDGYRYQDITLGALTKVAGADVDINDFTSPAAGAGIDFNTGVYRTENKAIFKGDYIVYYPYNDKFNEVGTIPAVAETEVAGTQNLADPALGKNTFRYGKAMGMDGGAKAKGFSFRNLSGLIQINLKAAGSSGMAGRVVKNIILYSAEKNIVKEAKLSAAAIVDGNVGQALYDSWEGTNKINVDCGAGTTLASGNNLFYVTALPANIADLKVLIRLSDDSWAEYNKADYEVLPGTMQALPLDVAAGNFNKNVIYAVDDATLRSANLTYAGLNKTIKLIGDVKLTSDISISSKITIDGGKLIVPENIKMTVASEATIKSPIEVQGASCCSGLVGGELKIDHAKAVVNDVTLTPAETSSAAKPTLTLGKGTLNAGKTVNVQAGTINVDDKIIVKGDFIVAKDARMNVNAGGTFNVVGGTLTNNGTIEVFDGGSFAMLDASGSTTYSAGQNMVNNGQFIHNVAAGVGGATQYMQQNNQYICRVNSQDRLNDAYTQWTACSVIEITGGTNYDLQKATTSDKMHNGKYVDVYVSAPVTFMQNGADNNTIEIGNLKVDQNLGINLTKSVTTTDENGNTITTVYKRNLTVHGNVTANKAVTVSDVRTMTVTGNVTVKDNMALNSSAAIIVNGKISIEKSGKTLTYGSGNGKLQVAGNIELKSGGNFTANVDAKNITANNFIVTQGIATFNNRTNADIVTMTIANEIKVDTKGTFTIVKATSGNNIARITCRKLTEKGTFGTEYRPNVVM